VNGSNRYPLAPSRTLRYLIFSLAGRVRMVLDRYVRYQRRLVQFTRPRPILCRERVCVSDLTRTEPSLPLGVISNFVRLGVGVMQVPCHVHCRCRYRSCPVFSPTPARHVPAPERPSPAPALSASTKFICPTRNTILRIGYNHRANGRLVLGLCPSLSDDSPRSKKT
jgi:hypothetical protein